MKNFITIEGCEGVGKSTQIALLKAYFLENKIDAVFTREPGGSKIAEAIRNIVLSSKNLEMSDKCEAFLYASARTQHLHDIIEPALKAQRLVFCDRYVDSSYAYQGYARGAYDFVKQLNELAIGDFFPQYTIFLDLNSELGFARKGGVDKNDRVELENIDFHKRVYEGYQSIIKEDRDRFLVIDASGSKEQTFSKILASLKKIGIIK